MTKILFQGDSITDMNCRQLLGLPPFPPVADPPMPGYGAIIRENTLGVGYPSIVAGELSLRSPGKYEFVNRAMSGAKIVDAYANIKTDVINIAPDVISMLFGVNGVAQEITMQNGIDAEKFEKIYRMYIDEIQEALPHIRMILIEPYVLNGYLTRDHFDEFQCEVSRRAAAVKRISEDRKIPMISLQAEMSSFADEYGSQLVTMDGIHPTSAGSLLIARRWIDEFTHKSDQWLLSKQS